MSQFYIDLSVVEPYTKYLTDFKEQTIQFIQKYNAFFQQKTDVADDDVVRRSIMQVESINKDIEKIVITIDECSETMKRMAIAYRNYLGR